MFNSRPSSNMTFDPIIHIRHLPPSTPIISLIRGMPLITNRQCEGGSKRSVKDNIRYGTLLLD